MSPSLASIWTELIKSLRTCHQAGETKMKGYSTADNQEVVPSAEWMPKPWQLAGCTTFSLLSF